VVRRLLEKLRSQTCQLRVMVELQEFDVDFGSNEGHGGEEKFQFGGW
jgi:hypothetical protein